MPLLLQTNYHAQKPHIPIWMHLLLCRQLLVHLHMCPTEHSMHSGHTHLFDLVHLLLCHKLPVHLKQLPAEQQEQQDQTGPTFPFNEEERESFHFPFKKSMKATVISSRSVQGWGAVSSGLLKFHLRKSWGRWAVSSGLWHFYSGGAWGTPSFIEGGHQMFHLLLKKSMRASVPFQWRAWGVWFSSQECLRMKHFFAKYPFCSIFRYKGQRIVVWVIDFWNRYTTLGARQEKIDKLTASSSSVHTPYSHHHPWVTCTKSKANKVQYKPQKLDHGTPKNIAR